MALPLSYTIRNVAVRRSSALLTALGIALTVAVFAGVQSLNNGFEQMYKPRGRQDIALYLRVGANAEGESGLTRATADVLVKERPEIARDEDGRPLAARETYLAVYMEKIGGGVTNVPLRGIEPMSIEMRGDALSLAEGRWPRFGSNEVVVGKPLTTRMQDCRIGDRLMLNVTPFEVVGVYQMSGAQGSEVWGDVERMMAALERPVFQRVVARIRPGTDSRGGRGGARERPPDTGQVPVGTGLPRRPDGGSGGALKGLSVALTVIMGAAAILGAVNTMLAAVGARTHEVGVLLAIGYRRRSIFASFLLEAALLGLVGGALGILLALPFHGMETGAVNWNTFTEVSFAFELSPLLVARAVGVAFLLGLFGGVLPALRASMMRPVEAIRTR